MAPVECCKVFILIPVHNRKEITLSCLENLQRNGDLDCYQVVVIDDGSTDGTGEAIAAQFSQVKILTGDGNLWWTGAIALGMQYAYQQGAEFFIWLNDDCHPVKGALSILVNFMQDHPGAIAAPACQISNSKTRIENGCRDRQRFTALPGEVVGVESVSGYCVGIPAAVCQAIGYPDFDRFPHYSGDDMYTLKASRHGFAVCLVGDAVVQLQGMEQAEHTFVHYLRSRFASKPSIQAVFFARKSRYYLPGQYFYHIEKYAFPLGVFLFLFKLCGWMLQYIFLGRFKLDQNGSSANANSDGA